MFYTATLLKKKDGVSAEMVPDIKLYHNGIATVMTVVGFFMLFLGGKLLVDNAVILARIAGMSEMLIGLTIVAVGTSLPELATSIMAALKKQNDIAIGNIIGSNIFNIFFVLGFTAVVRPIPITQAANFDIFVCLTATLMLFIALLMGKKHQLQRWQGILMLIAYFTYITYLIIRG
jgi:cation:H+ antiporter